MVLPAPRADDHRADAQPVGRDRDRRAPATESLQGRHPELDHHRAFDDAGQRGVRVGRHQRVGEAPALPDQGTAHDRDALAVEQARQPRTVVEAFLPGAAGEGSRVRSRDVSVSMVSAEL